MNNKNGTKLSKKKLKPVKSDGLFKRVMADKIAAQEFLNEYLPKDFKALLNLSTVHAEKESYVEESLTRQLSDIVYSVKTITNEDAFIYILLESQSAIDHNIAFRLWKYTLLLLERHIKDKQKLPLVAPIVVYHGKYRYTAAKSLWELFSDPTIAKQLMSDKYLLVDLQSMSDDDIKKKQHLGMLEFFLKNIHMRDMLQLWEQFFKNFKDIILIDKQNGYIYIKSLLWYTDTKVENNKKEELTRLILSNLPKNDGENFMYSIADAYRDEGANEKTMKIVKNLLSQNIDVNTISTATGLSVEKINELKS